jgi:KaiC/GvpD/RAD55 family RecA-like ATPase
MGSVPVDTLPRVSLPGFPSVESALGGGLVEGSTTLIYGAAGLGKTRLALLLADRVSRLRSPVLYVSTEQTPQQLKLTAAVVGVAASPMLVSYQSTLEGIEGLMREKKPRFMVVDSLQEITSEEASLAPRARRLTMMAREQRIPLLLTSHETKDGDRAGTQTVEHIVDCVVRLWALSDSSVLVWEVVNKYRYGAIGLAAGLLDTGGVIHDHGHGVRRGSEIRGVGFRWETDPGRIGDRSGSAGSATAITPEGAHGERTGGADSSHGAPADDQGETTQGA